jgi:DNA-binding transcriptional LysR family regulator
MSLTVRQLEIIRAVSVHGSVTEAASALGISQPAISLMLRDCASHAGFPFFVRKHGRLQATRETQVILAELNRIFDSIERVNRLMDDMREMTVGTVQVAAVPTLADNLLSPTIAEFQKSWPHIQISVFTLDNLGVFENVVQERVDFGLGLSPLHHRDGRMVEGRMSDLCASELVCVVHPDSPLATRESVTPADLAPYPLISFGKTQPLGALIEESFQRAGVVRRIALEVTLTSVACSLARSGAGAAIIDPFHLWAPRDYGVVTLRYRPRTEVKAQMLLPNNTPLSRSARLFVSALQRTVQERGFAWENDGSQAGAADHNC